MGTLGSLGAPQKKRTSGSPTDLARLAVEDHASSAATP